MGIRYRKVIKLAPGVRMNLSKSGLGWTVGPRGSSIGVSRRGVYGNLGIPGTGLYARNRIGSAGGSPGGGVGHESLSIMVGVSEDGVISFQDREGNPLPDRLIRMAKRQQGERIRSLIEMKCDEINGRIEALGEMHMFTPRPTAKPTYIPREFERTPPIPPVPKHVGLLGRLFRSVRRRIVFENLQQQEQYDKELHGWNTEREVFLKTEERRKDLIERRIYSEQEAMETFLEANLHEIGWPRETNVALEVRDGGSRVFLDVDLPEIEDMPSKTASAPQRGYKLTIKEMSATKVQQLYMNHVHGIAFRIIGETFAALPKVDQVVLSGCSQRADPATGSIKDEYLYSVRVERALWAEISFENLRMIDVTAALAKFDLRREMSKSGAFRPIEPFSST